MVPKPLRREVMQYYYAAPAHGHLGVERTYLRIRDLWYWSGMQNEIARYVTRCPECIRSQTGIPREPKIEFKSIEAE